eukprot:4781857-Prymnesium_polylepis.1
MLAAPPAPTPCAQTRDLPPNPDAFRGGLPGTLRPEHPQSHPEDGLAQHLSSVARVFGQRCFRR